jgi:DNA-binding NarL/FixJ family response regulator
MRLGIAGMINARPDMTVISQAGAGEEAIVQFRKDPPDLTLMDLRLPGAIGGVEAISRIHRIQPQAKIIVLTTYEGDEDIHRALEAGARGYVTKGMPYQTLLDALQKVHAGGRYLLPPVARALASRMPDSDLSSRELQVLELLVSGNRNKEIANHLGITEATVKSYVSTILMRVRVEDRTQAAVTALAPRVSALVGRSGCRDEKSNAMMSSLGHRSAETIVRCTAVNRGV